MVHYARLRPRLTKLTLAWIWLGLISAGVSFGSTYELVDWQRYTIWGAAGILVFVLFALPVFRYSATYLDVFSTGITIRQGLGSSRRIQLGWSEIVSINVSPIKGIVIRTEEEKEYVLRGYSNQRAIVSELQSLRGGK